MPLLEGLIKQQFMSIFFTEHIQLGDLLYRILITSDQVIEINLETLA